jgi:hypothetical protein
MLRETAAVWGKIRKPGGHSRRARPTCTIPAAHTSTPNGQGSEEGEDYLNTFATGGRSASES